MISVTAIDRATCDMTLDSRGLATPKVSHRATITDPKKLGALLRAIAGCSGQPTPRLPSNYSDRLDILLRCQLFGSSTGRAANSTW
jgi:hypothetical protein